MVISIILLLLIFFVLTNSSIVIPTILSTLHLWTTSVLPTLFIFFILIDLAIKFRLAKMLSKIFDPIFRLLFKTKYPISSFVIFTSFFAGNPATSKMIKNLLDEKVIDHLEANHLLRFCTHVSPIFIIGIVGEIVLQDNGLALKILIAHVLANILVGFIGRFFYTNQGEMILYYESSPKYHFFDELIKSIEENIHIMFLIGGIMIFANLLIIVWNLYFNLPYVSVLFELVSGINFLNNSIASINLKIILITMLLTFGGLSVHMQVYSILKKEYSYKSFLINRFIAASFSGFIVYLLCL